MYKLLKNFFSLLSKITIILICFIIFTLITIFILFNFHFIQNSASTFISTFISKKIGYEVHIEGFRINFPITFQIKTLTLKDNKGKFLDAENTKLSLLPTFLFKNKLEITNLLAEELVFYRVPIPIQSTDENEGDTSRSLSISQINIKHFIIKPELSGLDKEIEINCGGNIERDGSQKQVEFNLFFILNYELTPVLNKVDIQVKGLFEEQKKFIKITNFVSTSGSQNIEGNLIINLKSENIISTLKFSSQEVREISPFLQGKLMGEIKISGAPNSLLAEGKFNSNEINYDGNMLPDFNLVTELKYNIKGEKGVLTIKEDNKLLTSKINFIKEKSLIKLPEIKIDLNNNQLMGRLEYNLNSKLINGELNIISKDLNSLSSYTPISLKGEGNISLILKDTNEKQFIQIDTILKNLSLEEIITEEIKGKIIISDFKNQKIDNANISFQKFNYKDSLTFTNANFQIISNNDIYNINCAVKGSDNHKLGLEMFSILDFDPINKNLKLEINKAHLNFRKIKVLLTEPLNFFYTSQKLQWEARQIKINDGIIQSAGYLENETINSNIIFKNLQIFAGFENLSSDFERTLASGELSIQSKISNPEINLKAIISKFPFLPGKLSAFTLEADYKENKLILNSKITKEVNVEGLLKASLPVHFSLYPFLLEFSKEERIMANTDFNLPLDKVVEFFLPPIHRIKGKCFGKIGVEGTIDNPILNGKLIIEEGKYEYPPLGIKIKNINSLIEAKEKKIVINKFYGEDVENKKLKGSGSCDIGAKDMPFKISLITDNFFLINHSNFQATTSVDLTIKGNKHEAKIKGKIHPKLIEVEIPQQFSKEIPEINIVKTIPSIDKVEINNNDEAAAYKILLDIMVSAQNKIFVRGRGVDIELGGTLDCNGFVHKPNIVGKLKTIHGKYQGFGKIFIIKTGDLIFEGDIPPSPRLRIIGSTKQDDIEILLILAGPLSKPTFSIESSPPLPSEDALSYLLFGQTSTNISPFQALRLANDLRTLSGKGGNQMDKARSLLGLDDIKFKSNSNDFSDATIGIGKYLTDKIYIELEKGKLQGSGKTRIEVELRNNLSVESSVDEEGTNSIGINWKKDY